MAWPIYLTAVYQTDKCVQDAIRTSGVDISDADEDVARYSAMLVAMGWWCRTSDPPGRLFGWWRWGN